MVRLICLDLDGTLLDDAHRISPANRAAIDLARSQGVAVTLATGRMFGSALIHARDLVIDVPLITMNGALIKHPVTEEKLLELAMGRDELDHAIALITHHGYRPNFYDEFNLYVGEGLQRYYHTRLLTDLDSRYRIQSIDDDFTYDDLLATAGHRLNKGIFFPEGPIRDRLRQELLAIGNLSVVASSPTNLEITHHGADKGKAILTLAGHLGISAAEVMVIGDSDNDRSMLEASGYPVAMGNATAELKAMARYITADNNRDGVAQAIHHFIGGQTC